MNVERRVDDELRVERAKVVATLARRFGDLDLAEDATQDALLAAAVRWPIDGRPDRPGAWLTTTAYRKAVGMLRSRRPVTPLEEGAFPAGGTPDGTADVEAVRVTDDLFALLLTCCHPALAGDARVALTLRHVCGLGVGEIAAGFLVPEATMTKRLVRARRKIVDARLSFEPPTGSDLDERLDDVRTVVYLVFTEGHLSAGNGEAVRTGLCDEAVWLARQLVALRPDDGESLGLLALLLLHHARNAARLDGDGRLVPLPEQRRERWDDAAIAEARALLARTGRTTLGRYAVEAAVALLHVTGEKPDWARIADLYGVLARLAPSPVVEVNRALAVASADGAPAGLALLGPVLADGRLQRYAPLHAVHAELLERADDPAGARAAWARAVALSPPTARRRAAEERLDHLDPPPPG